MNIKTINQEHQIEIMKIKIVNYLLTSRIENMNIKTINQNIKLSSWGLRSSTKITKLRSWGQDHQRRPSNQEEEVQIDELLFLIIKNMSIKTINWVHRIENKRIKIVNCWHWNREHEHQNHQQEHQIKIKRIKTTNENHEINVNKIEQSTKTVESRKKG